MSIRYRAARGEFVVGEFRRGKFLPIAYFETLADAHAFVYESELA